MFARKCHCKKRKAVEQDSIKFGEVNLVDLELKLTLGVDQACQTVTVQFMNNLYALLGLAFCIVVPWLSFKAARGIFRSWEDENQKPIAATITFVGLAWILGTCASWFLDQVKPDSVRKSQTGAEMVERSKKRDYEIQKRDQAIKDGNIDSAMDWNRRAIEHAK